MQFIIKKYIFHLNKSYKELKKKLYNIIEEGIDINKDDKKKLFKEMENTFNYKDESGEPLRNVPLWENVLDYYDKNSRPIFNLFENETESEKIIRLNEIKKIYERKLPLFERFLSSVDKDNKIMEEYNTMRQEIINISKDIIDKIEKDILTKKDIDIYLQKYENIISKRISNSIDYAIKNKYPKYKIFLIISSIIILSVTLISSLIGFLTKHKKSNNKNK